MMPKRAWYLLATLFAACWLTGCYEEPGVTFYDAGQYKGRTDPLLEIQRSDAQQEQLVERLRLVQTDR